MTTVQGQKVKGRGFQICIIVFDRLLSGPIAVVPDDVDLQYWTSKVSFTAIFSNICTVHAQKRLFMNFRYKLRHRRSIRWPRFPIGVQNFGDLAMFTLIFAFYVPNVRHISTSRLFDILTYKVYHPRRPPRR